jgi:mRNA interferase MazF
MKPFPKRGEVYWVDLDPTIGSEIQKRRPGVIISNDIGNEVTPRVIVAPMTSSASRIFPFQVAVEVNGKTGRVLLDQIRTVDKRRLGALIGRIDRATMKLVDQAIKVSLSL